jgi:hypothetical protein
MPVAIFQSGWERTIKQENQPPGKASPSDACGELREDHINYNLAGAGLLKAGIDVVETCARGVIRRLNA